jgi:hypothetical protein
MYVARARQMPSFQEGGIAKGFTEYYGRWSVRHTNFAATLRQEGAYMPVDTVITVAQVRNLSPAAPSEPQIPRLFLRAVLLKIIIPGFNTGQDSVSEAWQMPKNVVAKIVKRFTDPVTKLEKADVPLPSKIS